MRVAAGFLQREDERRPGLGNAVREGPGFTLFDVGQFERISPADTLALMWLLCAISTVERRRFLRRVALGHVADVSALADAARVTSAGGPFA